MSEFWFYADANGQKGPVTLEQLKSALKGRSDWKDIFVWREGFADWQRAGAVAEIVPTPPPLPKDKVTPEPIPIEAAQSQPKKWTIRKLVGGVASFIVAVIVITVGREIGSQATHVAMGPSPHEAVDLGFSEAERRLKADLPKKIDDATTLVNAAHEGMTLTYYYEIDTTRFEILPTFIQAVRKSTLDQSCKNSVTKKSLAAGGSYQYVYQNSTQQPIGTFVIKQGDCN